MAETEDELDDSQKPTLTSLARKLSRLPSDKKRVALEASASIAGVSLRASREFVEAVPKAAKILTPEDLRAWAEMGRRLAMANADLGANFFAEGIENFKNIREKGRSLTFEICNHQFVLSS